MYIVLRGRQDLLTTCMTIIYYYAIGHVLRGSYVWRFFSTQYPEWRSKPIENDVMMSEMMSNFRKCYEDSLQFKMSRAEKVAILDGSDMGAYIIHYVVSACTALYMYLWATVSFCSIS